MKLTLSLGLALLLLGARPCGALSSAGAEPLHFLFLDANARPVAMAGAYTALAADSNALLYNPGGLGRVRRHEATFMHNQYFGGITQEYLGVALRQGVGLNLNYLSAGGVARTTISNPDGTTLDFTGLTDWALGAGYGRSVGGGVSLGLGLKFIREEIAGISANGYAADFGGMYETPVPGLNLGLAVQNVGPPITFEKQSQELPLNYRGGAAFRFDLVDCQNTVSFDLSKERSESLLAGFGAEAILSKVLAVRVGYNSRHTVGSGVAAGLGWISKDFNIDMAIVSFGALGLTHRFSATLRWGADGSAASAQ